eukprot:gnl/TRDRNA2_/TRDRNA2_94041_c0_seq1.p1 gnl/TRDRNA2_/TRDRNA2_94041_c0~~gnl/TRDRNA2_/TRDRNA2_94041_c0_seq1.p1  ORF type:complete len:467 (-),score=66.84 gnl/TRDRNA2_/TRDRNA2_94041_c0_seq1:53-1453(-)
MGEKSSEGNLRARAASPKPKELAKKNGADKIAEKATPAAHHPHYEFNGPPGAVGIMLGLPFGVYALFFVCGGNYCLSWDWPPKMPPLPESIAALWSSEAALIFLAWFGFQVVLERLLPCKIGEGVVLKDGTRLKYRLNGHLAFWVSLAVLFLPWLPQFDSNGSFVGTRAMQLARIYDLYLGLATAAIVFSALLSTYLYARSFRPGAMLADGGHTGNHFYDFFIGRELNPRIGSFDLKCFCELRPGLIGWAVINFGMALKQRELHGSISPGMACVCFCQALYVWDALFAERSILTTMDITTDGFGYMLAFGDLAWVPFSYSLQARVLVDHDPRLSLGAVLVIFAINMIGYAIFRGANLEKDRFRRDPNSPLVKHLQWMPTKRGTRLLTSGWWGLARKINYTGDWIMGVAWCLPCGFGSIVPYFYAIYFAGLLVHRAWRDDVMCTGKYGADWVEYKKKVPAVFIPRVI